MFKRDEDEKRTSTVQRSTSGILSSLTTELGKGVVASNSYSNSPKTRGGGATITKNFESLIRQPSLTNLFDYKATTTNASSLPSVRKKIINKYLFVFRFLYIWFLMLFRDIFQPHPSCPRQGHLAPRALRRIATVLEQWPLSTMKI